MKLTHKQSFSTTENQNKTLDLLGKKYKLNVSKFIRDAVNEKLSREKETIFSNYKEIQDYVKQLNECPF
jgi:hypothetical protein